MRNVFLFIRRYFTLLFFLALQGTALWFLFTYNRFHRAVGLGMANEITGWTNARYARVDRYFHLKEENARVHRMNDSLLNLLHGAFLFPDTTVKSVVDTTRYDSLRGYRHYLYRDARVVNNSVNSDRNYIQLDRGATGGIRDNMAVVGSDGSAVGIVVNVSPHFSQVMSLLHVQNKVNASLKGSGEFGTVEWDGKDPRFLTLRNLPKSIQVHKGDTVITSAYSYSFPPGYLIGTIAEIVADNSTGFYVLKVRTAANFYNLQQVHVIENLQRDEQVQLAEDTKKKIEEPQKQR
ncbi:MAG TPA: rod shape-determining protein MreC [Chitinophagaceae bacterium]|nr:rod shape-determining protein MreC [Chitinophagaceae bacterium]